MRKGQGFDARGRRPQKADPRTLEEIQRRTPKVAGSVELTNLPDGISINPIRRPGSKGKFVLPFHPVAFEDSTNAVLQPAHVLVRHVERKDQQGGGVTISEPTIGGTSMWADPRPRLELAGDVSYNYCTFNTNQLGNPDTDFTIVSLAAETNSTHHIPPDPGGSGGVNGVYYIELFRTNFVATENQVTLKWGGILPWYVGLWQGVHVHGSGAQPYARFNETADRHEFRTHVGGHGHTITQQTDHIDHVFCGTNVGTEVSNYANVYTGNTTADCAGFNIIAERNNDPQVSIIQASNESPIYVQGNNNDAVITFNDSNGSPSLTLTFVDGLLKAPTTNSTYSP